MVRAFSYGVALFDIHQPVEALSHPLPVLLIGSLNVVQPLIDVRMNYTYLFHQNPFFHLLVAQRNTLQARRPCIRKPPYLFALSDPGYGRESTAAGHRLRR